MTLCCIKHTLCSCPYSERVFSQPNSRRRTTGHSECIVCVQSDHDERAQRGWLELTPAFTAGCSQPRRVWCLFPWRQRAAAQSWHEADGLVHTRAHLSLSLSLSPWMFFFPSLSPHTFADIMPSSKVHKPAAQFKHTSSLATNRTCFSTHSWYQITSAAESGIT